MKRHMRTSGRLGAALVSLALLATACGSDGGDGGSDGGEDKTITFAVIPGWTEGVQLMVVGERRRFWIPVELAYDGRPGMPAGMLVFDVELLAIAGR